MRGALRRRLSCSLQGMRYSAQTGLPMLLPRFACDRLFFISVSFRPSPISSRRLSERKRQQDIRNAIFQQRRELLRLISNFAPVKLEFFLREVAEYSSHSVVIHEAQGQRKLG